MTAQLRRFVFRTVPGLALAAGSMLLAEPIRLGRPETTFHAGSADELACVIDGVAAGPRGWLAPGCSCCHISPHPSEASLPGTLSPSSAGP